MAKDRVEIGQIALDLNTLQGDVKTAEGIMRTLKTNLRDLSNLRINANGELSGGLSSFNAELDKNNKKYASGREQMRQFYAEQRLGDRITRDSTTALVGFTVGLSSLINSGGKASNTIQRVNETLLTSVTAMQGAEFTTNALGIAGSKYSGTLGVMASMLLKNAGWISVIVGLGAGLISFFRQTDEAAKKAAEGGINDIANKFKDLTPRFRMDVLNSVVEKLREMNALSDRLERSPGGLTGAVRDRRSESQFTGGLRSRKTLDRDLIDTAELQAKISLYEDLKEKLEEVNEEAMILEKIHQAGNEILKKTGNELQKQKIYLEELQNKLETEHLTEEKRLAVLQNIEEVQKYIKQLSLSPDEIQEKKAAQLKEQFELGKLSTKEYINQLQLVKTAIKDKEKALTVEKQINDIVRSTRDAELERTRNSQTQIVNITKETGLQLLAVDEQLVTARTASEEEKVKVTQRFALERLRIEEEAAYQLLDIESRILEERLKQESNPQRRADLRAQIESNTLAKLNLVDTGNARRNAINQSAALGLESARESQNQRAGSIRGGLVDDRKEFGAAARLAQTMQLNEALLNEETKLATIEQNILREKDAALLESLNREREVSLAKIEILNTELDARQKIAEQQILLGFQSYDASKSIEENFKALARTTIQRLLAEAVASHLAAVFASSGPLGLILAPTAGFAVAALFEQLIPKFGKGGKLTKPSLRLAGEAGAEFYAPERTFYDVARQEIIPTITDMTKRELVRSNTVINNSRITNNSTMDFTPLVKELKSLRDDIVSSIESMPPPMVVNKNPISFRQALQEEYPRLQQHMSNKEID